MRTDRSKGGNKIKMYYDECIIFMHLITDDMDVPHIHMKYYIIL